MARWGCNRLTKEHTTGVDPHPVPNEMICSLADWDHCQHRFVPTFTPVSPHPPPPGALPRGVTGWKSQRFLLPRLREAAQPNFGLGCSRSRTSDGLERPLERPGSEDRGRRHFGQVSAVLKSGGEEGKLLAHLSSIFVSPGPMPGVCPILYSIFIVFFSLRLRLI